MTPEIKTTTERTGELFMNKLKSIIFAFCAGVAFAGILSMLFGIITREQFGTVLGGIAFIGIVYFGLVSDKRYALSLNDTFRIGVVFTTIMQVSLLLAAPAWVPDWTEYMYDWSLIALALGMMLFWFSEASAIGDRIAALDRVAEWVVKKTPEKVKNMFLIEDPDQR